MFSGEIIYKKIALISSSIHTLRRSKVKPAGYNRRLGFACQDLLNSVIS